MKGKMFISMLFLCCVWGAVAVAGVQTHTINVPLQPLDFDTTVDVPLYDGATPLEAVKLTLDGYMEAEVRYENQSGKPGIITWTVQAVMTLMRPDLTTLVVTLPGLGGTDSRSAFDGVLDFGGTSGRTLLGLVADKAETASYTGASDLALFTGVGTIGLPLTAEALAGAIGPGTMASQFVTSGAMTLTVEYTYGPPVAEPSGLGLVAFGLLAFLKRRS